MTVRCATNFGVIGLPVREGKVRPSFLFVVPLPPKLAEHSLVRRLSSTQGNEPDHPVVAAPAGL